MKNKPNWGVIGLGVMGTGLSRNFAKKGIHLALYNRHIEGVEENIAEKHCQKYPELEKALPYEDLSLFIHAVEIPRKILLMLPAGVVIDSVLNQLTPLLSNGDIIIDGGNSHFEDTEKRVIEFAGIGIYFLGMGVSGGEEGALNGPSLMLGGDKHAYSLVSKELEIIAAKNSNGTPCCAYLGSGGAGHFVKMIHNGIEYAEMQLLAEVFELTQADPKHDLISIKKIFSKWQKTSSESYLLKVTLSVLNYTKKGHPFINLIKDEASNKGTGAWATASGAKLGNANSMMAAALYARFTSSDKVTREAMAKHFSKIKTNHAISLDALKKAYDVSRLINHHQGFEMIREASLIFGWKINLSSVALVWSEGCILKSTLMFSLIDIFKSNKKILEFSPFIREINSGMQAWEETLDSGIKHRIPLGCFSSAWNYFLAITQKQSNANLIQAQRDYFGAHGFKRTDIKNEVLHHGPWSSKKN